MEKQWAATGYDERFFDDDWETNLEKNPNATQEDIEAALKSAQPTYPFAVLEEEEWKESGVTWEEEGEENVFADSFEGPGWNRSHHSDDDDDDDGEETARLTYTPPEGIEVDEITAKVAAEVFDLDDTRKDLSRDDDDDPKLRASVAADLTPSEEAARLGFNDPYLDVDGEPEGPPAVMLAGFRAEELPRVRELLDELGGHDVPVIPVPQAHLARPLSDALSLPEPDWESPRVSERFNQGGEFGSQRAVIFSGLDRGEMACVVSAIERRGLPRLLTAVITSDNAEKTLGEALATAVKESREEKRRRKTFREQFPSERVASELRELQREARREGLSVEEIVAREIKRQDQAAADDAAATRARDERVRLNEAHLEKLKEEYVRKARARAAAEAVSGGATPEPDAAGWPTLEDTVRDVLEEDGMEIRLDEEAEDGVERFEWEDDDDDDEGGDAPSPAATIAREPPREDDFDPPDDFDEDGTREVDPVAWSARQSQSQSAADLSSNISAAPAPAPAPPGGIFERPPAAVAERAPPPPPPIDEPPSSRPNPMTASGVVGASVDAVDAEAAPENDVVEAQVMTKKMLRELAARRGVSYTELARQAEASGVELPDE